MSAPDRIWRNNPTTPQGYNHGLPSWTEKHHADAYGAVEYIRSDLVVTETQPDPRDEVIKGLMDALNTIRVLADHNIHGEPETSAEDIHECVTDALAAARAVMK